MARRSKTYVELEGADDLRRAFARLEGEALTHVKAQVQESAQVIERDAKARLAGQVDEISRRTAESIKTIIRDFGLGATIGSGYFNARFKEQGTSHEPARPFLNPAFQSERNHYLQGVQDALNTAGRIASKA